MINGSKALQLISIDGAERWSGEPCDNLRHVIPAEDGDWLALICHNQGKPGGYIQVIGWDSAYTSVRSEAISFINLWAGCTACRIAWFANDVFCAWSTSAWGHLWPEQPTSMQTLFMEFHSETVTLDSAFAVPGLYRPVHGASLPKDTYLRIIPPDTVQLVRFDR
jgi:hypothetical protein